MGRAEARKKHDPKYFSAGPAQPDISGRVWAEVGPWAGTSTVRLRQARNDTYKGTKRPIYLLKPHFIPYFHVLYKEHKIRDNAS
jgi:hypothetical protein